MIFAQGYVQNSCHSSVMGVSGANEIIHGCAAHAPTAKRADGDWVKQSLSVFSHENPLRVG